LASKQPLTDGPFLAVVKKEPASGLRFRAYLNNPGRGEKEFKASSPERLREFIEAYWLDGGRLTDEEWDRVCFHGHSFSLPRIGTIHVLVTED
jgi:hypothetical protein